MAWGVYDVDVVMAPSAKRRRRLYGDPLFAFQVHRVHFGADAVFAADFVDGGDAAGVVEDALGQGGLARVNVGGDADIAEGRYPGCIIGVFP